MLLASAHLAQLGPFADTSLSFAVRHEDEGVVEPRMISVVFGGSGTGKTLLLAVLAQTRPGHALPPLLAGKLGSGEGVPVVSCAWILGRDAADRPHPLVVTGPSAVLPGESADLAMARRREQAHFDKRAQSEGGFVFVAFSGARWFSRTPNMLTTPDRTILRWDPRVAAAFDDPSRADLARETKQVLAYAEVAQALSRGRAEAARFERLAVALREVLDTVLAPFDVRFAGVSPITLEPELVSARGDAIGFDALPKPAKHLAAIAVLSLRALVSAYPAEEEPRLLEGVVAVDDLDAQQDPSLYPHLVPLLRAALPGVQWILTTSRAPLALACDAETVVALRAGERGVEPGEGLLH